MEYRFGTSVNAYSTLKYGLKIRCSFTSDYKSEGTDIRIIMYQVQIINNSIHYIFFLHKFFNGRYIKFHNL